MGAVRGEGIEPSTSGRFWRPALCQLSYPRETLPQEGKRREVSPEILLSAGDDADGHRLVRVVTFGLDDDAARDAARAEEVGDGAERVLVGDGEHDGERPLSEVPGARLAARVKQVRGEDAQRKIATHDRVVGEGRGGLFGRAAVSRFAA